MGNLLGDTGFVNLISQSGHYMDDDVYCMTVVVSHTKVE
jgi:hypothetical protein